MPAGALESGISLRLPGQWEDTSWQAATSGADVYHNVHRWYSPAIGRFTRPDPLGARHDELTLFGFGRQNPLSAVDPLGLMALAPDTKCRAFPNAVSRLQRLLDDCPCTNFFAEAFGADLSDLVNGPLPTVEVSLPSIGQGGPGGRTPCDKKPGVIKISRTFCGFGMAQELAHVLLHELGHYADCHKQRFPVGGPIDEGALGEIWCLGETIDQKPMSQLLERGINDHRGRR